MRQSEFTLSDFQFQLPEELIAQAPVSPRDSSRLMVLNRADQTLSHRRFTDLPEYFAEQDIFVANNTKVMKARLLGNRLRNAASQSSPEALEKGGKLEFVLLEEKAPCVWEGLMHASAKYVVGLKMAFPTPDGGELLGEVTRGVADSPSGTVEVTFDRDPLSSGAGELPLPHYIDRATEGTDDEAYQTVYASQLGSAAAPTAGLHFTDRVLAKLRERGARWEEITLHVGLGTFRPVKTDDLSAHVMHEESYEISNEVAHRLNEARRLGKRITAVGTTSVRTLEGAVRAHPQGEGLTPILPAGRGRTSLFIRPSSGRSGSGFEFVMVDRLLTNFHLPGSTLLMLVSAFAGRDFALRAYEEAIREKYRFFSYGDAMLIL